MVCLEPADQPFVSREQALDGGLRLRVHGEKSPGNRRGGQQGPVRRQVDAVIVARGQVDGCECSTIEDPIGLPRERAERVLMPFCLKQLTVPDQARLAHGAVCRAEHGGRVLSEGPGTLAQGPGEEVVEAAEVVQLLTLGLRQRHAVGACEPVDERLADPGRLGFCQVANEPGQPVLGQQPLKRGEPGAHGRATGVSSRLPHSDQDPW